MITPPNNPQKNALPVPPVWYKKKYLVYSKFQTPLILMNSLVTMILFILTVLMVVRSHIYLESIVKQTRIPGQNIFIEMLNQQLKTLLTYMGGATLFAVVLTGVVNLLLSHKMAGPMIKLRSYFGDIEKSGKIERDLQFRKNDFFIDLPPTINKALHALKKK